MSNVRVKLTINNQTGNTIKCTNTKCESISGMEGGVTTIADGESKTFTATSSDRIFCTWVEEGAYGAWEMGMTCPKSSSNSAYGSTNAGLQHYDRSGTPVEFEYIPGTPNQADWNHGNQNNGDTISYGDCS